MTWPVFLSLLLSAAAAGIAATWAVARRLPRIRAELLEQPSDHRQPPSALTREALSRLQDATGRSQPGNSPSRSSLEDIQAQLAICSDPDERAVLEAVAQLVEANSRMQRQLDTAEERLQAQARQMESQAMEARTDALTQVANRRALDDELKRCCAAHDERGVPATVLIIDIDHFKKLNDTYGHQAGDDVLRGVARALRGALGDSGLVARFGGEEFAVVFPRLTASAVIPHAERARLAIASTTFRVGVSSLNVTASGGLAEFLPGESDKALFRRADEALYASKRAGRNRGHYNDGRSNHLIQVAGTNVPIEPLVSPANPVGDEWLYEDNSAASPFQVAIPQLASRPIFFDELIRRLGDWRRGGGAPLTLLLIQVDSFSRIAGDHGAAAGSVVMRVAAQLINAVMRDLDQVSQLGEDSFVLLLPGAALNDGLRIAERLRSAVERCRLPRKACANWFTISVGAVEAHEADDLRLILQRGRGALSAAVSQGRNRVLGHDASGSVVQAMEMAAG